MEEYLIEHWNNNSRSYDMFVRKGFSNKRERTSWQKLFKKAFGEKSLKILDTGCGPGIVSMQLADLGHHMTAIDFSDRMLDAAKDNALRNHLEIEFLWADAEALPFENSSFEAVVSDYMLWTVPDPKKVMREWFRVMKPGSTLAYVDGDWWHDDMNTPIKKRISHFGVFLDSPRKFITDRNEKRDDRIEIWSKYADRPNDDTIMLEEIGFQDIRIIHDVQDLVLHGVRHLAYGSTEDHFMIIAKKPYGKDDQIDESEKFENIIRSDNTTRRYENGSAQ